MNVLVDSRKFVDATWFANAHRALRETIPKHKHKEFIGCMYECGIWDSTKLKWKSAETRLRDCLDPGGDQFFKWSDLWLWMHQSGERELLEAMNDDLKHRPADPSSAALGRMVERYIRDKVLTELAQRSEQPIRFSRASH